RPPPLRPLFPYTTLFRSTLARQEVEQLITFPVEVAMSNIMNVEEIRSVSRFGLSVVTVVFKESVPILDARQLINEQTQTVAGEIDRKSTRLNSSHVSISY